MTKSSKPSARKKATRRTSIAKGLGLSESVLKFFPKISRMGRGEPSRWSLPDGRQSRAGDRQMVDRGIGIDFRDDYLTD